MENYKNVKISNMALQVIRKEKGFTQESLAEAMGKRLNIAFEKTNISHWESGRRAVPSKYIVLLCDILECDIDDLLEKRLEVLGDNLYAIPPSILQKYNQKPVYVHFDTYNHADAWALVNATGTDIELIFVDVTLKVRISSEGLNYYAKEPIYNLPEAALGKSLGYMELMGEYRVYVTMKTGDGEVMALYNGWYHHNENRTALIKDDGVVLPYSGLGKSFEAHKEC